MSSSISSDAGETELSVGRLDVAHIAAGYGKLQILHDVSISVRSGQSVCVLGANGSGKSTLLKTVIGWVRSWRGSIALDNERLDNLPTHRRIRKGIQYVAQGHPVFSNLSVEENLLLSDERVSKAERAERLDRLMNEIPILEPLLGRRAGLLSGGERQLVGVGRCLLSDPRIVVLDEPSAGLSPKYRTILIGLLMTLKAKGVSLLLVEQNADLAIRVADHAYFLEGGRIALDRATAGLLEDHVFREQYVRGFGEA